MKREVMRLTGKTVLNGKRRVRGDKEVAGYIMRRTANGAEFHIDHSFKKGRKK